MIGLVQRYVLHNFGLKFLSLLLAAGLWFLISPDEQPAEVAVRAEPHSAALGSPDSYQREGSR